MPKTLSQHIQAAVRQCALADGPPISVIGLEDIDQIARCMKIDGRAVELAALRDHILPDRYLRNMKTLSLSDQLNLLESTVGVIGLGGLGGMVTETLARMGIGSLHLIDGDRFEPHNLNRQLLSCTGNIGMPKAEAAVLRIKQINPGIDVISRTQFLTAENVGDFLLPCRLVVDCLDTIKSRFVLQRMARHAGIPMVSAAVAGMSGHVTTIYPEDKGLETIYGPSDQADLLEGAETHLGCLAAAVNLVASLECAEAVKILLGKENTLRNKLLAIDLTDYTFETLRLG